MDRKIAPEAKIALDQMKEEYAQELVKELVISNPTELDRANMTSRQNGYIGGYMSDNRKDEPIKQAKIANSFKQAKEDDIFHSIH